MTEASEGGGAWRGYARGCETVNLTHGYCEILNRMTALGRPVSYRIGQ